MNPTAIRTVMNEAHQCAMAMLSNASYIERELPNVPMDAANHASTIKLCSQLIGTKHDIVHELSDLDDLLKNAAAESRILSAIDRILRWLEETIDEMHLLVTKLDAAAKNDPACAGAYILVAESAVNVLLPFNRAREAARVVTATKE